MVSIFVCTIWLTPCSINTDDQPDRDTLAHSSAVDQVLRRKHAVDGLKALVIRSGMFHLSKIARDDVSFKTITAKSEHIQSVARGKN